MAREVRWERMFPDEIEAACVDCPVAYFPYGLCEPHGPHNALGCDTLRAHAICRAAARQHGGIVAPAHSWHVHGLGRYATWGHEYVGEHERTWLTCLPPWMFFKNMCYHVRTVDVHGFRAAIFFSGHGGPHGEDATRFFDLIQPRVGTRLTWVGDADDLSADPAARDRNLADHAGKGETSMLWAMEPSCVDTSRFPDPAEAGPHFAMGGNARAADRRTGEWMLQHKTDHLGRRARQCLDDYAAQSPKHTLRTFEDVEVLWDEVVRPQLSSFESMRDEHGGRSSIPPDSVWYENWRVPDRV